MLVNPPAAGFSLLSKKGVDNAILLTMNGAHLVSPWTPAPLTSRLDLSDVPVVGQMSTTGGVSVGDALTASTGSLVLDASAGAVTGYLLAAPTKRPLFAVAGALAGGGLGLLGLLGVGAAAILMRR